MGLLYKNQALKKYLDALSGTLPAPGGGSAAALNAAMGAALLSKVIHFTLGKPKYAKYEDELKNFLRASEAMRLQCLHFVDLDVIAFRSKNLRDALNVPFMLARIAYEGMKFCAPLVKKGNAHLISDVAVAAIFFESAFAAAYCNVEINLKLLGDKKLAKRIHGELDKKSIQIQKLRKETERKVGNSIRR